MRPVLLVVFVAACGGVPEEPTVGDRTPYGAFEIGKLWPYDDLIVCWMADVYFDPNLVQDRADIETIVRREWGRVGRIRFSSNWDVCDSVPGAHIRIGRERIAGGESKLGTDALLVPLDQPTLTIDFAPPSGGGCVLECAKAGGAEGASAATLLIALHELGHALGLRHEYARADNVEIDENGNEVELCTDVPPETLDGDGYNGEPLWDYDTETVVSQCHPEKVQISAGDIQTLHTLYPGVVAVFAEPDFDGDIAEDNGLRLGPGYYTRTTTPALASVSSIVVPPGIKVRACTRRDCRWLTTSRELSPELDDQIEDLAISPWVIAAEHAGYDGAHQWLWLGVATESSGTFGPLAGTISSLWVPPTRAAQACTIEDRGIGSGDCRGAIGDEELSLLKLPYLLNDNIRSVNVTPRVVTYTDAQFRGESRALDAGVYKVSTHGLWLRDIRALAISGMSVAVCTEEGSGGPFEGGSGICRVFQQSVDWVTAEMPPIRYLEIAPLPTNAPPS